MRFNPPKPTTTPPEIEIGVLSESPSAVAARAVSTLGDGRRIIWVGDDAVVHSSAPDRFGQRPACWIVGTYEIGFPIDEIAADVAAAARERTKDWIID